MKISMNFAYHTKDTENGQVGKEVQQLKTWHTDQTLSPIPGKLR